MCDLFLYALASYQLYLLYLVVSAIKTLIRFSTRYFKPPIASPPANDLHEFWSFCDSNIDSHNLTGATSMPSCTLSCFHDNETDRIWLTGCQMRPTPKGAQGYHRKLTEALGSDVAL